jgi:S1-C subfamily serine protease
MKVDPIGSAADAGIRQGDLIQEVNRRPVHSQADFNAAVQLSGARPALVLIKRRNTVTYVTLKSGS